MAASNMIVTLAMNATKYAAGLRTAASKTTSFGSMATKAFNFARTAVLSLTVAFLRAIPALANMGAESRKADIQLRFMLENMQGVSKATNATVKRMDAYATSVSIATAVDDELIKTVQKKLLMFKAVRSSADEMGGAFDRATSAAIDLAAGGFGEMESNAVKLGRMLQDPTTSLTALNKAGVVFTQTEKEKIIQLAKSGKLYEAQDLILQRVEKRVKGLAEETATPFEKMMTIVNEIGDKIGEALLEPLGQMNDEIRKWLGTPQAKRDVQAIADAFVAAAYGVRDLARFLVEVRKLLDAITKFNMDWVAELRKFYEGVTGTGGNGGTGGNNGNNGNTGGGGGGGPEVRSRGGVVINFNTPIDSVSAGREVARVLADFNRANGARR